jgi:Mg/Co/Ni transporter MgtE
MAPASAAQTLMALPPSIAGDILQRATLPAAVAALRTLNTSQVSGLLKQMSKPKAARIRLRLRFSEWAIAGFVDDDVLTLSPEHRVGDALRLYRGSGHRTGQVIAVIDDSRRLIGVVDLLELLKSPDRRVVRELMQPPNPALSARVALQTVVKHPAWATHDSLPVISRNGFFQGVLRRSRVVEQETHSIRHVAEANELVTTRAALADIFWLALGALFVSPGKTNDRDGQDS